MNSRTLERASYGTLIAGVIAALAHALVTSSVAGDVLYGVGAVVVASAAILSARVNTPDVRVWGGLLIIGVLSAASQVLADPDLGVRAHFLAEVLSLSVQVVLVLGLLVVAQRRIGREPLGVLADSAIVALGAWLVCWILLLRPLLETSTDGAATVTLRGIALSAAVIVLLVLATLLFGDAENGPVVWLASGAIVASLIGDVLWAVHDAALAEIATSLRNAPYVLALFAAAATLLHPTISNLAAQGPYQSARPMAWRLVTVTSGLVVPLAVFAITDAQDTRDRVVRSTAVIVLACAVLARVILAVRSNAVLQQRLVTSAQTDALTGLPNRSLMLEHVDTALRTAWRDGRQPAVLFIDVDRFKNINDSLGHAAGDDVLMAVAGRLRVVLPDYCVVGRIAGDEFVVLDPRASGPGDAMLLADRVLESFHEPLALRQGDVFVSASIGVSTYRPSVTNSADDLLRHADTAMYRAKESGRNCVAI